jgi:tetratricopeptide (TPR) repeat protein
LSGYTLYLLGEVLAVQGHLAAARKSHAEALAIRREIGDTRAAAESHLALAVLAIEAGDVGAAESAVREQVKTFRQSNTPDKEALALGVLARALLAQGQTSAAREAIERATALSQKTQDTTVRLTVAIDASRVRAASGNVSGVGEARKALEAAAADATTEGLTGLLLEARLALGQVELAAGDRAGAARLAALQRDATARGYSLIARKASASR